MAAVITADFRQYAGLQAKIDKLIGLYGDELRSGIGAVLESSARRRVGETKLAPDGTPWPAWSPGYAKHRPAGKSLLQDSGGLLDSIQFKTTPDSVIVFAAAEHAATHQFGDDRAVTVGAHKRLIRRGYANQYGRREAEHAQVSEHRRQRNIPPRPFLGLGSEDVEEIELLIDGLAEQALGAPR